MPRRWLGGMNAGEERHEEAEPDEPAITEEIAARNDRRQLWGSSCRYSCTIAAACWSTHDDAELVQPGGIVNAAGATVFNLMISGLVFSWH